MRRPVVENSGPTDVPVRTGMNGWRSKAHCETCFDNEEETDLLLGVVERSKLLLTASFVHDGK